MPELGKTLTPEEFGMLFRQTALKREMTPAIVEKDYWVCWIFSA